MKNGISIPKQGSRTYGLCVVTTVLCLILWGVVGEASTWPNQCGDGRIDKIIDDFENPVKNPMNPNGWYVCCQGAGVAPPTLTKEAGCSGASLAIHYDLSGATELKEGWIVIVRDFTPQLNLTEKPYTHLRIAVKGLNPHAHHNFQIKLQDSGGRIDWVVATTITELPAWRVMYVDLREFTCFSTCQLPLNLSAITQIQVGIAQCVMIDPITQQQVKCITDSQDSGGVLLDELAAVDLHPEAKHRLKETKFDLIVPNPDLRASTAKAVRDHWRKNNQEKHNALCPAWFEEADDPKRGPNYNTYSQALCLLIFVEEYERTEDHTEKEAYKEAANRLAGQLLNLQIPDGKINAAAWYTAYRLIGDQVVSLEGCTGDEGKDEQHIPDRDRCEWIGNTAWAVIALDRLKKSVISNNPADLEMAIANAAAWMGKQTGRITGYPDLVTVGLEGNISTYFGLLAASKGTEARRVGNGIYKQGWDTTEARMKIGASAAAYGTAMDTAGSWGVDFLRSIGKQADALLSQAYAATILRTTSFDGTVDGYGDIAGPWTMTVEFSAQGMAAGVLDAQYVMQQINGLQAADGSFPGSTDNFSGGTFAAWTTIMHGVAPTAFVYVAQHSDPLLDLSATLSLILTGCTKCQAGNQFAVQAHLTNPGPATKVEVRIGVRLPDGTPVSLINSTITLPAVLDWTGIIFDFKLPPGLPTGTYTFEGALLEPLGKTLSRSTQRFEVMP